LHFHDYLLCLPSSVEEGPKVTYPIGSGRKGGGNPLRKSCYD